jgi:hypothetical protein
LRELNQNMIWCDRRDGQRGNRLGTAARPSPAPGTAVEPKRLRLRLFSIAGRLARSRRRTVLHLSAHAPWAAFLVEAITNVRALAASG